MLTCYVPTCYVNLRTATDPRHIARQKIVQELFEWSFRHHKSKNQTVKSILTERDDIDKSIADAAREWPLEQIAKVDLAILRLAIYELKIAQKNPQKVVIDEAVELAKEFGGETSSKFINGVLGTVIKSG